MIDLRNLTFDVYSSYNNTRIDAGLNGTAVGTLIFKVNDERVKIVYIEVVSQYQNLGIGQMLYKTFGEIYSQNYSQLPIVRDFVNPIAEYAYRKAIGLGWISEETLDESLITRRNNETNQQLWTNLRDKLPENIKGPINWE